MYEPPSDATPKQKMVIARLLMALHNHSHLEQQPMTKGEAGRLIRELSSQIKYQNLGSGKE